MRWLTLFNECGISINEPFSEDQILQYAEMFGTKVEPEQVLLHLGWDEEEEPYRHNSLHAFNLDTEYIDNDDSYAVIIERIAGMTGGALVVKNVKSSLDMPDGEAKGHAHIEFDCNGQHVEINISQDSDWCDEAVLHCMAALLNASGATKCIFATPSDDQTITMACTERACLERLKQAGLHAEVWNDRLPMTGVSVMPEAR